MKVIVLMSTYNGEKYLREQLDSLLKQDCGSFRIFIRDDGSKDDTIAILEEYSSLYPFISYYIGNNLGPAKSFWELIQKCEKADYYALCDQDDVWLPDKISSAVHTLGNKEKGIPLLYCSRFTLTDEKLNPINSEISKLYGFTDFPHSLIYHTAPGCTFVFNDQAREMILKYDIDKEYCIIHDALIHKIVCLFGKMILDPESHIYYRQHGENEIGMNADKATVFIGRIRRFLNGKMKNYRSSTAASLLKVYGEECSEKKRELLDIVANYKTDPLLKKKLLSYDCFKTKTVNDVFFRILVWFNYI